MDIILSIVDRFSRLNQNKMEYLYKTLQLELALALIVDYINDLHLGGKSINTISHASKRRSLSK